MSTDARRTSIPRSRSIPERPRFQLAAQAAILASALACAPPFAKLSPDSYRHPLIPITYSEPQNGWAILLFAPLAWLEASGDKRPGFSLEPGWPLDQRWDVWNGSRDGDIRLVYNGYRAWHMDAYFHCLPADKHPGSAAFIRSFISAADESRRQTALDSLLQSQYVRFPKLHAVPMGDLRAPAGPASRLNAYSELCEQHPWEQAALCLTELFAQLAISKDEVLLVHGRVDSYLGADTGHARDISDAFDRLVASIELSGESCTRVAP